MTFSARSFEESSRRMRRRLVAITRRLNDRTPFHFLLFSDLEGATASSHSEVPSFRSGPSARDRNGPTARGTTRDRRNRPRGKLATRRRSCQRSRYKRRMRQRNRRGSIPIRCPRDRAGRISQHRQSVFPLPRNSIRRCMCRSSTDSCNQRWRTDCRHPVLLLPTGRAAHRHPEIASLLIDAGLHLARTLAISKVLTAQAQLASAVRAGRR